MATNPQSMTPTKAEGGIDKKKQQLAFGAVVLLGALIVIFLIATGNKKKSPAQPGATAAMNTQLTSKGAVSQYSDNLNASIAHEMANNAGSPNEANPFQGMPSSATQQTAETFPAARQSSPLTGGSPGSSEAPGYGRSSSSAPTPFPSNPSGEKPFYMDPKQRDAYAYGPAGAAGLHGTPSLDRQEDDLEKDHKKRIYMGRYVSNIALSRRGEKALDGDSVQAANQFPAPGMSAQALATPQSASGDFSTRPPMLPQQVAAQSEADRHAAAVNAVSDGTTTARQKHPERMPNTFLIPEGTAVDCVLQNRLNGDFSGPVKVMVSEPLYDRARERILIPAGSIFIGEARATAKLGQERLAVSFHRLQRTDGYTADLDQFTGLDSIGETALKDLVNHHYTEVFGVALALGGISGYASSTANTGYNQTGTDEFKQGFSQSLDQSAMRIIDKYTNILPTIIIREGTRVKVYFTNDFYIPASVKNPVLD